MRVTHAAHTSKADTLPAPNLLDEEHSTCIAISLRLFWEIDTLASQLLKEEPNCQMMR